MQGSKYAPTKASQYSSSDLNMNFQGGQFNPTKGDDTNCDFLVTDDHLIDGGRLITTGATLGDSITAQVVDKDNVLGYGTNVVLKTFVSNWPIYPGSNVWDFASNYPAKIFHGLYIRIIYHSVATVLEPDPKMACGYRLHKILW